MRGLLTSMPGLGITQPAFKYQYDKWMAQQEAAPDSMLPVSAEEWGKNLAVVSRAVVRERGLKKGSLQKSTDMAINEVPAIPGLSRATVNTHIRKGMAGKMPGVAGRGSNLSKEDELRLLAATCHATDDLEPCSCAETQGLLQGFVGGTDLEGKFKGGNVTRQYAHNFRSRYDQAKGGVMFTSHP